jgi:hypothetical protein
MTFSACVRRGLVLVLLVLLVTPGAGRARDASRGGAAIDVRREDVSATSLRRQFLSVPIHDLLPGRYELEVAVRDRIGGQQAAARMTFVRE